jgi:hypothetical protein
MSIVHVENITENKTDCFLDSSQQSERRKPDVLYQDRQKDT